jgi:hypothetical protein
MSKDGKDKDAEELSTKRASKYRYDLCTFCKVRHPPPSGQQCVMALLNASERGEVGIGARRKTPMKSPMVEQQQLIIDDKAPVVVKRQSSWRTRRLVSVKATLRTHT